MYSCKDILQTHSPLFEKTSPRLGASGLGWTSFGRHISDSTTACLSGLSQNGWPPLQGLSHSGSPSGSGLLSDKKYAVKTTKTFFPSRCFITIFG